MNYSKLRVELIINRNNISKIKGITISNSIPVSYTHLDVYKRQELYRISAFIQWAPLEKKRHAHLAPSGKQKIKDN